MSMVAVLLMLWATRLDVVQSRKNTWRAHIQKASPSQGHNLCTIGGVLSQRGPPAEGANFMFPESMKKIHDWMSGWSQQWVFGVEQANFAPLAGSKENDWMSGWCQQWELRIGRANFVLPESTKKHDRMSGWSQQRVFGELMWRSHQHGKGNRESRDGGDMKFGHSHSSPSPLTVARKLEESLEGCYSEVNIF